MNIEPSQDPTDPRLTFPRRDQVRLRFELGTEDSPEDVWFDVAPAIHYWNSDYSAALLEAMGPHLLAYAAYQSGDEKALSEETATRILAQAFAAGVIRETNVSGDLVSWLCDEAARAREAGDEPVLHEIRVHAENLATFLLGEGASGES